MNWYKQAQLNKTSGFGKAFLGLTIPAIALLIGGSFLEINKQIEKNPQELAQKIRQVQEVQQPIQQLPTEIKKTQPTVKETIPVAKTSPKKENINLDKIWEIESSRGKNLWNERTRARGHFQFVEATWNECVTRMGETWDWWNDSMDYNKSSKVADYYLNTRIPQMLNYYKIPDNVETRLGSYNWGIGFVKQSWEKYKENWVEAAPAETRNYITTYKG